MNVSLEWKYFTLVLISAVKSVPYSSNPTHALFSVILIHIMHLVVA